MTGGSQLDLGTASHRLLSLLALTGMLLAAFWLPGAARAQETAPAGQPDAPAPRDIEVRLDQVLADLNRMSPPEIRDKLDPLLKGDLTGIRAASKVAAFHALATAYERLAQDFRINTLDPAAERKKDEALDAAVAAYINAAQAAADAQDYATADQAYGRALMHRPNSGPALLGTARVLAKGKKSLQALERYQDYLKQTGQDKGTIYEPQLYVEMGRVYADASLWHQAMKAYREALRNGVDTDEVAAQLASCHMALGQAEAAFKQAEKAISKNRTQPAYYRLYAELLLQRNAFTEAAQRAAEGIAVAKDRLAKEPGDRTTLSILNDCYGTYVRALEYVVARNPSDLQARLTLVQAMKENLLSVELLTYYAALDRLRNAPVKDREDVALLEERIRLENLVHHKDLRFTCEQLLQIQPANKLARETLAALGSASQPANADGAASAAK